MASTFAAILEAIAAIPLEKGNIHLSTKVVGVNTTNKTKDGGKVIVTSEKGESFEFDEVVMTTPLGWLKKNKPIFSPPLPPRIEEALDNITLSKLEKVRLSPPSSHSSYSKLTNNRSTSHSPHPSGSTTPPPTAFPATQTGSPPPTPPIPIPHNGPSNAGTSLRSMNQIITLL